MPDSVYDLPRLTRLYRLVQGIALGEAALRRLDEPEGAAPTGKHDPFGLAALAVLSGSFNPLTRGHEALVEAARRAGCAAVLLLLPLRAVDKEGVTHASAVDRALMLQEWAARRSVDVALVNRGLYVEQAALLAARYPSSRVVFVVGHDKIVQIFDPRYYERRDEALRALFARASFRVAPRQGRGDDALRALLSAEGNDSFAPSVEPLAVDADVDALSSTVVRETMRDGRPWERLVPGEVARFLRATRPYAPPILLPDSERLDPYALRQALIGASASGALDVAPREFARLCRVSASNTPAGERLRAQLAAVG